MKRHLVFWLISIFIFFSCNKSNETKKKDYNDFSCYISLEILQKERMLIQFNKKDSLIIMNHYVNQSSYSDAEIKFNANKQKINSYLKIINDEINFQNFYSKNNSNVTGLNIGFGIYNEDAESIAIEIQNVKSLKKEISMKSYQLLKELSGKSVYLQKIIENYENQKN